jgi:DnaJ-domain-containing protein 1
MVTHYSLVSGLDFIPGWEKGGWIRQMDQIFNRLYNMLRSAFNDDPFDSTTFEETKRMHYDPDMAEAWEELDEYLKTGSNTKKESTSGYGSQNRSRGATKDEIEQLRKDYTNLEVPFGASFEEVRKAYKNLLRKYHPDRFATDPNKLKIATEITKKINESYQKIKVFEEKHNTHS